MLSPNAVAFGVEALLRTREIHTTDSSEISSEISSENKDENENKTETKYKKEVVQIPREIVQKRKNSETCYERNVKTLKSGNSEELESVHTVHTTQCYSDQCSKQYSEYSNNFHFDKAETYVSATCPENTRVSIPIQLPHQEYLHYQFTQRYNLQSAPLKPLYLGSPDTTVNETKQAHKYLQPEQQEKEQQQLQIQQEQQRKQQRLSVEGGVTVGLQHPALWNEFHRHQTEMIITKNGRRMFPVIKIRVFGLNPDSLYMIYMDMEPIDGKRYRYAYPSSTWVVAGSGDGSGSEQVYIHTDSPSTGRQWMDMLIISFDKLKLTNNRSRDAKGQIFLQSMQKYKPRIWVQCLESLEKRNQESKFTCGPDQDSKLTCGPEQVPKLPCGPDLLKLVDRKSSLQFSFTETSFITVTAYQNQRITRLKINSNPFAKGFRDNYKYKETIEKHMMTSASCGMHCRRPPYFPFTSSLSSYFFQHPFSHILPLTTSSHLRPAAPSLNRWLPINPSGKPSETLIPTLNPFFNTSFSP